MVTLIVSEPKLLYFKKGFYYYNNVQGRKDFDQIQWEMIPRDFRYFISNNRSFDALSFYNIYCGYYIGWANRVKEDLIIIKVLNSLKETTCEEIKQTITDNEEMWNRLIDRSSATQKIDLAPNKNKNMTQSLLHVFSSGYENTEALIILYWISEGLVGRKLSKNFDTYKDNYGNFRKGNIITDILKLLKLKPSLKKFRRVVKNAYNKTLRHTTFHNSAILDDEKRIIRDIDNSNVSISYAEAFKSIYSLQQLHNYLRIFCNYLLLDENSIVNEGVISSFSYTEENGERILALLQLEPFFEFDSNTNNRIKCIDVVKEGSRYILSTKEKEILNIKKDTLLNHWYERSGSPVMMIYSIKPNIYENDSDIWSIDLPQYGEYLIQSEYRVEKVSIKL